MSSLRAKGVSELEMMKDQVTYCLVKMCSLISFGDRGDAFLTAACAICLWQSHRLCFHTRHAYVLSWRVVCCSTWHYVSLLCVPTTSVCSGAQSSLVCRCSSIGVIYSLTCKHLCIFRSQFIYVFHITLRIIQKCASRDNQNNPQLILLFTW